MIQLLRYILCGLVLICLIVPEIVEAQSKDCRTIFINTVDTKGGPFEIISSEKDSDRLHNLSVFTQQANEIASSLGYRVPSHQLSFVPSDDLSVFISTNGYASPHWIDGSSIINEYSSHGGVLEIVYGGDSTCRSFYKDTNNWYDQISTILHVLGHNDVSSSSYFYQSRVTDPLRATLQKASLLSKVYEYDHDQGSRFFQYLDLLTNLQDYHTGSYRSPDSFIPKDENPLQITKDQRVNLFEQFGQIEKEVSLRPTIPAVPTQSVLQGMVAYMKMSGFPKWQIDLADLSEQYARTFPFIVQTKFMNEGWATFSEYFLLKHMPKEYRTSEALVAYGQLNASVSHPNFSNPYWLGLEAWFRLYDRFCSEHSDLDEFERDKAFVSWAHKRIETRTDFTFLQEGLDEAWVNKYNLALYRELTSQEIQEKNLPPPPDGKAYYIVLTKDYKRIVDHIIRKTIFLPLELNYPKINLVNMNKDDSYVLYRHTNVENIPLNYSQAAMSLWILTQLHKKTVALETIYNNLDTVVNIRIKITPVGEVSLELLDKTESINQSEINSLIRRMEEAVKFYQHDLDMSYSSITSNPSLQEKIKSDRLVSKITQQYIDQRIHSVPSYVAGYTKWAYEAMREYFDMIKLRIQKQLQYILEGKQKMNISSSGVRIPALPIRPRFVFDKDYVDDRLSSLPPAPVDGIQVYRHQFGESESDLLSVDDVVDIFSWEGVAGDIFISDVSGGGEGPANQAGRGIEPDPQYVDVPLDQWGEILSKYLALKNIKHEGGRNLDWHWKRRGTMDLNKEPFNLDATYRKAFEYGLADRIVKAEAEGREFSFEDIDVSSVPDLIEDGFGLMPAEQMVHIPVRPKLKPDFDAVVVFAIDLSGSMHGELQEQAKRFVYSTVAALRSRYKYLDIRYVGYSDEGYAYEYSEEEIWKIFLSGGTSIKTGYQKAEEIIDSYSSHYSKYIYNISDAGDFDPVSRLVAYLDGLRVKVQHMGFVHVNLPGSYFEQNYVDTLKTLHSSISNFDFTQIDQNPSSIFDALMDLFGTGHQD